MYVSMLSKLLNIFHWSLLLKIQLKPSRERLFYDDYDGVSVRVLGCHHQEQSTELQYRQGFVSMLPYLKCLKSSSAQGLI